MRAVAGACKADLALAYVQARRVGRACERELRAQHTGFRIRRGDDHGAERTLARNAGL